MKIWPFSKIFNLFKKHKKVMNQDKLAGLFDAFRGRNFQWVKTEAPQLLGKIVKCIDITPYGGDRYMIIFNDGSKIDSSKVSNHLMMITEETPAMNIDQVKSINQPPPSITNQTQRPPIRDIKQDAPQPTFSTPEKPKVAPSNIFSSFSTELTRLTLVMQVNLPDKKLLKMMYDNSDNKEKFRSDLADHIMSIINKDAIYESVDSLLKISDPKVTKKRSGDVIVTPRQ